MEDSILDVLGLQIVDYFINFENYQPYNTRDKNIQDKGKVYLVNKSNNSISVIKIIKQNTINTTETKVSSDHIISDIKSQFSNHNFKFLTIIINNEGKNEVQKSLNSKVIIGSPSKIISEIAKVFPNISKIIKTDFVGEQQENQEYEDDDSISPREKKWKKINFQNRHFLKDAEDKSSNSRIIATWLFFAVPIVTYFIFYFLSSSNDALSNISDGNILILFFGGSYHNLVIGGNQYWRWITYPFVQFNSIALIFSLWMFYRVGRYIEGFYGIWKAVVIWIGAIVLAAIMQTSVDLYNIMYGFNIVSLISIGAMIPIIWNYKLFKSKITGKLGITLLFFFLYWILLDQQVITLLYWMIAFASGWIVGAVVSYQNRKLTLFYSFSPISIGLIILFFILVYFLSPYKNYDSNNYTEQTLKVYQTLGLASSSYVNWVNSHFFGPINSILHTI